MNFRLFFLALFLAVAGGAWAKTAPDFTLPDSEGRPVTLSSYRGKYVVLEFLVTTCPHCQAAAKVLEKMQLEYPTQLQVLGIGVPVHTPALLAGYKRDHGVTYPVLLGTPKVLTDYFGTPPSQVPSFVLISPSGEILQVRNPDRDKDFYANTDPNLESMIRQAIPKKGAASAARKPAARKQ